ncbi:SdpI family protein [Oerskovia turbata]|uniref:SdpI family protein n=1 Tax=Oerskovia turbata TaxID=1713 RepID=UPI0004BF7867|nr:SdpI family protein [Oerskovia turbata]
MLAVWIIVVVALLVAWLAWLGATDRITRNALIGIRTPATQRSDAGWIAGHRAALTVVLPGAALVTALAVVGSIMGPDGATDVVFFAVAGAFLTEGFAAAVVAEVAARGADAGQGDERPGQWDVD